MADISKIQVPGSATQYNIKDAQARRDIEDVKADLADVGMSSAAKAALLACFRNVAWINENGQDCYSALETALGMSAYPKIVATFNPGVNVIYTDDALDTLKQYMTVKYVQSQGATGTTISANDYTLTGVLSEGANAVLVSYGNYKTVVSVTAVDFYNIHRRTISNGLVSLSHGSAGRYNDTLGVSGMALNTRRVACTDRGKKPYISSSTFEDTNIYPIPVPLDATSVTASLTPNTMYCAINIWQFDIATSKYTRLNEAGWNIGENTLNFTSGENLFIAINIKKDSGGTSDFNVEPSELVVEFN